MRVAYGSYLFDTAAALPIPTTTMVRDPRTQLLLARRDRVDITAYIGAPGDDNAQLDAATLAVHAALQDGLDLVVYLNDGTTVSAIRLYNIGSLGTRIVAGPSWTNRDGAEYASYRKLSFSVEAEYPVPFAGTPQATPGVFGGTGPAGPQNTPGTGTGWVQSPAVPFPGAPSGAIFGDGIGVTGGGGGNGNTIGGGGGGDGLGSSGGSGGLGLGGASGSVGGGGALGQAGSGGQVGQNTAPPMPPKPAFYPCPQGKGQLGKGIPGSASSAVNKFTETVRTWGGGPVFVFLNALNGPPQKQLVYPQTPFEAAQSGSATGMFAYPPVPPPIWPAALFESPVITEIAPKRKGLGWEEFTVSWSYKFKSVTPLNDGLPNVWRS